MNSVGARGTFWEMGSEAQINRLAAKQHGVFSGGQLRSAGFDKHAVGRRLASGHWIQLDYRVFALPSARASWERQVWVALLSRKRALVGGRTAANLHGIRGFNRSKPVILVPGSANARSEIARVVRSEHFDEVERVTVAGFPVISRAETVVALARELDVVRLGEVLDQLLLSRQLSVDSLDRLLQRDEGRRRKGMVALRRLIEDRDPQAPTFSATVLEQMLIRVLDSVHLPPWTREHPFSLNGRPSRVDVFVPEWSLVMEADGRSWHARVADFERDRQRDNALAAKGVQVLRFTYSMLKEDRRGCVDTILAVGQVRSA